MVEQAEVLRRDIREIFDAGLRAADPKHAMMAHVSVEGETLLTKGAGQYPLVRYGKIFVFGAGKAASPMASALEDILDDRIYEGLVITKYGHGQPLRSISVIEAGHPVPDTAGLAGAERMISLLGDTTEDDLVIFLLSGGGSALLPLPCRGITLSEKQETTQALLECGATIHEINAVRKHISGIKGGNLAGAAFPSTVITFILSDVIGDDLDVIASGPTVPDRSTFADCVQIIEKYDLGDKIPRSVVAYLEEGRTGGHPETPKPGDLVFRKTESLVIGSSGRSMKAARDAAEEKGYHTLFLSSFIEGETRDVAKVHAAILKEIIHSGHPVPKPACIVSGGETTVTIRGKGRGGRNTEFVLAAAMEIEGMENVVVLSGGTDGTDGPTDAAGAVADGETLRKARKQGLNAAECLKDNDSYRFFKGIDDLLITGPTMTNVMDIRLMLVT